MRRAEVNRISANLEMRCRDFILDHLNVCKTQMQCGQKRQKWPPEAYVSLEEKQRFSGKRQIETKWQGRTNKQTSTTSRIRKREGRRRILRCVKYWKDKNTKPYFMKGYMKNKRLKAMIDTGSPVTIFAFDELKRIMKRKTLQVRLSIKSERYVGFNGKPLILLSYVCCELQVGKSYVRRTRVLAAEKIQIHHLTRLTIHTEIDICAR